MRAFPLPLCLGLLFACGSSDNPAGPAPLTEPTGSSPTAPTGPGGGDGGAPDGASPPASADDCAATTNSDGWCWGSTNHPMSVVTNLVAFGDKDIWGTSGRALVHWDGKTWSPKFFASDVVLPTLWGASPTNVFAAGYRIGPTGTFAEGVLYRYDGKTWSEIAKTTLEISAMWGAAPNDIWLGTRSKAILHWDGTKITQVFAPSQTVGQLMRALDGTGPKDVWAVGDQGDGTGPVRHYDGTTWTQVTGPWTGGHSIRAVKAFAPNDVWVGGGYRQLHHFDGTTWTTLPLPDGLDGIIVSITGKSNDVTIAFTRDGGKNQTGDVGLLHYDGQALTKASIPETGEAYLPPLVALATTPSGTLIVSRGPGDVHQRIGGKFTRQTSGPQIDFQGSTSAPNGRVTTWGISGNLAVYENGVWTSQPGITDGQLFETVAFDSGTYSLAQGGRFVSFASKGVATTRPFGTQEPGSLAGNIPGDLWGASRAGVWHFKGGTWTTPPVPTGDNDFRKLFVTTTNDVYATISFPESLMKLDTTTGKWTKAWTKPVRVAAYERKSGAFYAIRGGTFGGGSESAILKNDVVLPIADAKLVQASNYSSTLAVCEDGRIYAAIYGYQVLAFDGTSWRVESLNSGGIESLHCDAQGTVWGFGSDGVIVKKVKK